MNSFAEIFQRFSWNQVRALIYSSDDAAVERALSRPGSGSLDDFAALLSPAAGRYLEQMAKVSHALTSKRFGNTILLYIPMYLSNECQNICTYCGFSLTNRIARLTLSQEQILREVEIISSLGFQHILLVTGEAHTVGVDYLKRALRLVKPRFTNVSIEVQPLERGDYEELMTAGLDAVLVYQETYNSANYRRYHPRGRKSNFAYRLETPDRLGAAGIHKIGLGALLGLEDWRVDSWFVGLHLDYLQRKYWRTRYSVSFPRLRPAQGSIEPNVNVSDRELVQLICAYRIFNENLELSLSTREHPHFRDHAVRLGITAMSAGSRTEPGGYAAAGGALEQFEISDNRSPAEVARMISASGYEPVWKDWDLSFGAQAHSL